MAAARLSFALERGASLVAGVREAFEVRDFASTLAHLGDAGDPGEDDDGRANLRKLPKECRKAAQLCFATNVSGAQPDAKHS